MHALEQAYAETAKGIVASVSDVMDGEWGDREWERIVVNHQTLLHSPEGTTSAIAFSIARSPAGAHEQLDFRISDEAEAGLENIAEIAHAQNGTYWTVCDVTIERAGTYQFAFSYDRPYRLSGDSPPHFLPLARGPEKYQWSNLPIAGTPRQAFRGLPGTLPDGAEDLRPLAEAWRSVCVPDLRRDLRYGGRAVRIGLIPVRNWRAPGLALCHSALRPRLSGIGVRFRTFRYSYSRQRSGRQAARLAPRPRRQESRHGRAPLGRRLLPRGRVPSEQK